MWRGFVSLYFLIYAAHSYPQNNFEGLIESNAQGLNFGKFDKSHSETLLIGESINAEEANYKQYSSNGEQQKESKASTFSGSEQSSPQNSFGSTHINAIETSTSNYNNNRILLNEHIKDDNPIMLPNQMPNIDIIFPPALNYEDIRSTTRASFLDELLFIKRRTSGRPYLEN